MKLCSFEKCNRKHIAKGLCSKHYSALKRNQKTGMVPAKVEEPMQVNGNYNIWFNDKFPFAYGLGDPKQYLVDVEAKTITIMF